MALQLFLVLSQNWNQKFILLWLPIPLNVYLTLRAPALAHLPHTLAQIFIQFFFVSYNNLLLHEINKFFCKNKIYKHCTHYVSTYFPSKAIHIAASNSSSAVIRQISFHFFIYIYLFGFRAIILSHFYIQLSAISWNCIFFSSQSQRSHSHMRSRSLTQTRIYMYKKKKLISKWNAMEPSDIT